MLAISAKKSGAWVLHMLRGKLGDSIFFDGIRRYYRSHKDGNATSDDFRKILESACGISLSTFFKQWLYQPGWPEYFVSWRWDAAAGELELSIRQSQTAGLFDMDLEIVVERSDGRESHKFRVFNAADSFRIPLHERPLSIQIDPNGWVLKTLSVEQ